MAQQYLCHILIQLENYFQSRGKIRRLPATCSRYDIAKKGIALEAISDILILHLDVLRPRTAQERGT
jgi:hypothetical protein